MREQVQLVRQQNVVSDKVFASIQRIVMSVAAGPAARVELLTSHSPQCPWAHHFPKGAKLSENANQCSYYITLALVGNSE